MKALQQPYDFQQNLNRRTTDTTTLVITPPATKQVQVTFLYSSIETAAQFGSVTPYTFTLTDLATGITLWTYTLGAAPVFITGFDQLMLDNLAIAGSVGASLQGNLLDTSSNLGTILNITVGGYFV